MSVNGVNQASSFSRVQSLDGQSSSSARPAHRGGHEGREEGPRRAGGDNGRQVFDAVAQALNSAGLSLPPPPPQGSAPAGDAGQGLGQGGSQAASDVGQALHTFMHDLFKALKSSDAGAAQQNPRSGDSDGDADGNKGPDRAAAYGGDLASKVQGLVESLSGSGGSAPPANTDSLNSAFKDLVKVLEKNGGGDASGAASSVTLQSFLQSFQQNIQAGGGVAGPVGGAVNELA